MLLYTIINLLYCIFDTNTSACIKIKRLKYFYSLYKKEKKKKQNIY
uniref:Uncharacterized protein n=1 Tax=Caloglossa monosticha TaxID=76906 RepID=A0A1Z1M581_9FLOR|nr:hypothetical protein [Caloglossa monosticha]ARW61003.1 hypothetical protein [Caloglossa monosticha]